MPISGIGANTFSVRWEGRVQATTTGTYKFRTHSDDGVRLWVNGQLVVDNWTDHAGTDNTTTGIALTGGQRYDVKMEFYDNLGGAVARLSWLRPGQSSYAIIPQAQLYPAMGGPVLFTDSFDNGLGNWSAVSGDWGNYGSYAGRSQLNASVGATSEELSIAATANWTNFSTAAWVNLANWNGGLGLLGRLTDTTHYYMLEIKKNSSGIPAWFISKRDGGNIITLASGSLTYTANTWLRLRLTMNGSTLTAESSTDGTNYTALGSATDSTFTTGRVGLRAWGSPAFFDDALVQGA